MSYLAGSDGDAVILGGQCNLVVILRLHGDYMGFKLHAM